jgi:hypothetical protein
MTDRTTVAYKIHGLSLSLGLIHDLSIHTVSWVIELYFPMRQEHTIVSREIDRKCHRKRDAGIYSSM